MKTDIITYKFFKSCSKEKLEEYYCSVQDFFKDDKFFYTSLQMNGYFHSEHTIAYRHRNGFCWPYTSSLTIPTNPKKKEFMIFDGTPKQLKDCLLQLLSQKLEWYAHLNDSTTLEMAKPDFEPYFIFNRKDNELTPLNVGTFQHD